MRRQGSETSALDLIVEASRCAAPQTVTGEDVDATDSIRLLRRLTLPKTWQGNEDAEALDVADVRRAQVPRVPPPAAARARVACSSRSC